MYLKQNKNKIFIALALLSFVCIFCTCIYDNNISYSDSKIESKYYYGPVKPTCNEDYFRNTGIIICDEEILNGVN